MQHVVVAHCISIMVPALFYLPTSILNPLLNSPNNPLCVVGCSDSSQSLRPKKLMGLSFFAAIIISYTQQLTIISKAAQKKSWKNLHLHPKQLSLALVNDYLNLVGISQVDCFDPVHYCGYSVN